MNMTSGSEINYLLSVNNPVFGNFLFWSGLLGLKLLLMSILTGIQRTRYKAYASEEDAKTKETEIVRNEPHVERVRSAHMNDLENILPYLILGILYICTDPNKIVATVLFRIATIARILHTCVYAFYPVPQPSRAICFFVHYLITIFFTFAIMIAGAKNI